MGELKNLEPSLADLLIKVLYLRLSFPLKTLVHLLVYVDHEIKKLHQSVCPLLIFYHHRTNGISAIKISQN